MVGPVLARLESVSVAAAQVVRESGVWGLDGSRSAKAFLERTTGASGAKIAGDLKLAERLATVLPLTAHALRAGVISGEHARVLSRGACGSPAPGSRRLARPDLQARGSCSPTPGSPADQFKTFVAAWAYRVDPDADDATRRAAADDVPPRPRDSRWTGCTCAGSSPPRSGRRLQTALTAVIGVPADDRRTPRPGAATTRWPRCASWPLTSGRVWGSAGGVRPQLVVRVDWRDLIGMPGLTGLDPAFLQESGLARSRGGCWTGWRVTARSPGSCSARSRQVLDVGRAQRTFTGPRRRALDARDGGCRAPGCDAPPGCARGITASPGPGVGRTCPDNGLLLCWAHHDWVHERDITITVQPDGGLRFTGPDGHHYGTTHPRQLTLPD